MTDFSAGPFTHVGRPDRRKEPGNVAVVPEGKLPDVFQFSQQSLQDYTDCERRFQLKYIDGQRWPAAESEPIDEHERLMKLGEQFHLLVQQHKLGIDADLLAPSDPELRLWWDNYLRFPPENLPALHKPEVILSTPIADQRLLARFDLLAIEPGERIVIVDWKTTRKRPPRESLITRMQTKVYLYVVAEAGQRHFGGEVKPEQISLVYWFAADPTRTETINYNTELHREYHDYFTSMVNEIAARDGKAEWPLTPNERLCDYCVYRSLCDRGIFAGAVDESNLDAGEEGFDFDLDDVKEIAF